MNGNCVLLVPEACLLCIDYTYRQGKHVSTIEIFGFRDDTSVLRGFCGCCILSVLPVLVTDVQTSYRSCQKMTRRQRSAPSLPCSFVHPQRCYWFTARDRNQRRVHTRKCTLLSVGRCKVVWSTAVAPVATFVTPPSVDACLYPRSTKAWLLVS